MGPWATEVPLAGLILCRGFLSRHDALLAARTSRGNLPIAMGDSTPLPNPAAIARAELFTREQFVYEGESLEEALAPGSARRRALDAALTEIDAGNNQPSIAWRRKFSLLLGLERLLSEEEPHLVDGTVLSAHQVDALSGTLTALLAEAQRNGNGAVASGNGPPAANGSNGNGTGPPRLASSAIPGEEEDYDLD
jgi:ribonuclease E